MQEGKRVALEYLAERYQLDVDTELHVDNIEEDELLQLLEERLKGILSEHGEKYFLEEDRDTSNAIKGLFELALVKSNHGLDYSLELWSNTTSIRQEKYPLVFYFLVSLPGLRGEGLDRENHGHGYHIHYVKTRSRKQKRTNIVFTFDPKEGPVSEPNLYWKYHGSGLEGNPDRFGDRRRNSIYDTSKSFLSAIEKKYFMKPGTSASKLWPL